jgi:ribonuclease HIII
MKLIKPRIKPTQFILKPTKNYMQATFLQRTCLQTYISNHVIYFQIVNEHTEDMDPMVVDNIQNIGIYKQYLNLKICTIKSFWATFKQNTSR